jgi:hypothetical protein
MKPMDHRNRAPRPRALFLAAALLVSLLAPSCKWGIPEYTLTVIVEEGVIGTPEAGQYTYDELARVEFDYEGVDPLTTVEVILNDRLRDSGEGTIIMYDDGYVLKAKLVDIRGTWDLVLSYDDGETDDLEFSVQLDGADLLSGTFTDTLGHHGTWTAGSDSLVLAYWDWEFYVLTNTVFAMGDKSGTFTGAGKTGTWTATRPE